MTCHARACVSACMYVCEAIMCACMCARVHVEVLLWPCWPQPSDASGHACHYKPSYSSGPASVAFAGLFLAHLGLPTILIFNFSLVHAKSTRAVSATHYDFIFQCIHAFLVVSSAVAYSWTLTSATAHHRISTHLMCL